MTEILNAISTIGFPCVMCILFFYYVLETKKSTDEQIERLTIAVNTMQESINNLTMELKTNRLYRSKLNEI